MEKYYYTYILASKRNGTLYVGVTSDLIKRVYQHRNNLVEGFTAKYQVHHLVYFEQHQDVLSAIQREKRLKEWQRKWKLDLIEKHNPEWRDLYPEITGSHRSDASAQAAGRQLKTIASKMCHTAPRNCHTVPRICHTAA